MAQQRYLLDTNICIFYMKGKYQLNERLTEKIRKDCFISEITVAELLYGASCSNRKDAVLREVKKFIKEFQVIPIYSSLQIFADVKANLRRQGRMIDDFDLLIGATALYNEMTVVTENTKHLAHIPGLKLENWIDRSHI